MALVTGTHFGSYEILSALGVGGMGEVYRARDTRLHRDVAIKVLLPAVANDPERLVRFSREAQVLASLNHPNIAHIHGVEDSQGVRALVMELVEGPTLADRIAQGAIPQDEALPIAKQIAEALEAAHEQGIVHRDLKPANIKVRPDGVVKVLDFGLAKALDPPAGREAGAAVANSPTITSPAMMTQRGVILGTSAYMSPEQAKGYAADKRSDVWAFGCVLYEMFTGSRAFEGEDVSDTLAAVIKGEPVWNALSPDVPHAVRALIQGCLRKGRKERIGDLSTARFLLSQPDSLTHAAPVRHVPVPIWRRAMLVVAGVLIGATIAATVVWRFRPLQASPVTRFALTLPRGEQPNPSRQAVAMSPDGRRIVYAADGRLYLRSLSELEPRAIDGTGPALSPVFSPDGQSVLFYSDSALKRIAAGGGTAVTICQVGPAPSSIAWGDAGILYSLLGTGIMRVSPNGGKPEVLVSLTEDLGDSPQLLPDGRTLVFTIVKRTSAAIDRWDKAQIVAQSLETGTRTVLVEGGSDGRYVPTGHIVYVSEGTLFAVPFDLTKLNVTGGAVPVVDGVRRALGSVGAAQFAFSNDGSLIYVPGPASASQQDLMLFDRKGSVESLRLPPGRYQFPRVSPDGDRIAFETTDGKEAVVSIYDVSGTSSVRRLTFGGNNRFPIWSADGRRVAFQSDREGEPAVFWQPADGGTAEHLTQPDRGTSHAPESWSPDGEVLLLSTTKGFVSSLWTFSIRDRKVAPFGDVNSSSLPTHAAFSRDGRWVAYQVGESGVGEATTYVQPFPATGTKYLISRGGRPAWSRDGKELFFVPAPAQFMVVTVRTEPRFTFTSPVAVPRRFGIADPALPRPFDMMPDGRFVGVRSPGQNPDGPAQIHVVLNWTEELKRLVPTR